MSQAEFQAWVMFYRQQPFDDMNRYHRPAAAIASSMSGNYAEKLAFLAPEPVPEGYSEADLNTFKAFGMKPPGRS